MRSTTIRAALIVVTLAPVVLVVAFAPEAAACPFCDGDGQGGVNEVRDGIIDDSFWAKAAATLAPFPILAGIVALIYFGPPRFKRPRAGVAGPPPVGPASSPGPRC